MKSSRLRFLIGNQLPFYILLGLLSVSLPVRFQAEEPTPETEKLNSQQAPAATETTAAATKSTPPEQTQAAQPEVEQELIVEAQPSPAPQQAKKPKVQFKAPEDTDNNVLPTKTALQASEITRAPAEENKIERSFGMQIYLINETGQPRANLNFSDSSPPKNVVFKYVIPSTFPEFEAWALEIREPTRKLRFRRAFEGEPPPLLHWDGTFSNGARLKTGENVFFRLILLINEDKLIASPWASFQTEALTERELKRFDKHTARLSVVPTGSAYASVLKSGPTSSTIFPLLSLDTQLTTPGSHVFGFRIETTSNILTGNNTSASTYFFSDVSLFYRYRLIGKRLESPKIEYFPPYIEPDWTQKYLFQSYPKYSTFSVGMRLMSVVLRGFGGTALNSGLIENYSGLAITGHATSPIGSLRLRCSGEIGYSLFQGRYLLIELDTALTYELFPEISLGPQIRYRAIKGKPKKSSPNANLSLTNQLFFLGGTVIFKI